MVIIESFYQVIYCGILIPSIMSKNSHKLQKVLSRQPLEMGKMHVTNIVPSPLSAILMILIAWKTAL